jgi:E3 ubiquitin-protein ligase SHPRH
VKVILLHAKTDSAGLTLVRATHVFLMEPLLNPAIELQAVARVHRMGQTKETHVHKFIIQNTIEERILLARRTGALKRTNTPPNATQLKKEENETVTKEELEFYLTV